ncbi:hypothetical protein QQM41_06330 [Acetobacter sp. AC2005]|uniref:hypothetical protein n=1 Tax=Acetobacter TaxID=434 RepID=UPI000676B849|nr:hypothetical protein [Acetobacter pasteurianus]AKR48143.1 hypothetical protein DB34_03695 [Acetobacter pasteurianus]
MTGVSIILVKRHKYEQSVLMPLSYVLGFIKSMSARCHALLLAAAGYLGISHSYGAGHPLTAPASVPIIISNVMKKLRAHACSFYAAFRDMEKVIYEQFNGGGIS